VTGIKPTIAFPVPLLVWDALLELPEKEPAIAERPESHAFGGP
jgi:hypothetical protein